MKHEKDLRHPCSLSRQRGLQVREHRQPLGAENPWLIVSKQKGTSVLQPFRTEFCQQPKGLEVDLLPDKRSGHRHCDSSLMRL